MQIGEVARRSGVSARMLRHYDALGLVRPSDRTPVGYREYSEADIRRIFHVEGLRSLGMSLKDIARALEDPSFDPAVLVKDLIERSEERIERESELLRRLRDVAATGPADWESVLTTIAVMNDLNATSPGTRQRAAMAAGADLASPDVVAAALLRERNRNVAGALRWALARSGTELPEPVAAALADADPAIRRQAAETAIALGAEAMVLEPLLADPDSDLAAMVAIELGRRGSKAALTPLLELVRENSRRDVAAAEALGVLATDPQLADDIVGRVMNALDTSRDYAERQRLVQALAELPGQSADTALRTLCGDADFRIAETAKFIVAGRNQS